MICVQVIMQTRLEEDSEFVNSHATSKVLLKSSDPVTSNSISEAVLKKIESLAAQADQQSSSLSRVCTDSTTTCHHANVVCIAAL